MLLALIVACEIGFWVVLAAGLTARYVFGRRRLGAALLVGAPVVDVVLLGATVIDLASGATADFGHGLAAAYIGFSVAFGRGIIRWADERFAHRFTGGPAPSRPPSGGWARARYEWREFGKAVVAWAIGCTLLGAAIAIVGDADRTAELAEWLARLSTLLAFASLWPITYTLWPAKPEEGSAGGGP